MYDYDGKIEAILQPEDAEIATRNVPDYENEFVRAKTFLQKSSTVTGENLYDHLTDILNKILAERPENVIDFFEEYSRKVKEKRFRPLTDHLEDIYVPPGRYQFATKLMTLLKADASPEGVRVDPEDEDLADMSKNDLLQLLYFFEQTGLGLPRIEMFCIMLAMKKLVKSAPISSLRFWGKIFGLHKDYIIVEAELKEEEQMRRNELAVAQAEKIEPVVTTPQSVEGTLEKLAMNQEVEGEKAEEAPKKTNRPIPPLPVNQYSPMPEPPNELSGVGVNKKIYYVCNEIGDPWIELPDVTPKQLRVARLILKSFTGNLDQEIVAYPEFPGNEKNYLRAQIARISAGSQISPLGFYTFGEGEGEEEEEEEAEEAAEDINKTTYRENPKYDPIPIQDLTDGSMSFWVHHTLYILSQGRTTWWDPNPPIEQGEDVDEALGEEEEADNKPKGGLYEPETGPPLLTPLSEDASLEAVPPWSVRKTSGLMQEITIAVVRSNLWPGAYCFATQGKIFQNVYLGFGHKYLSQNFSPWALPPVAQDYVIGPEIMELLDPLGADEEDWRIAHLPKPKPEKGAEEGAEEEEEEEEEDDDDD